MRTFSKTDRVIIAQIILYIFLYFSFNNATFFTPIFLFAFYIFWSFDDWRMALWMSLVATFPFGWGLRTFIEEIPLPFYLSSLYSRVPIVHFSLTPKFLISTFLLITLILDERKREFFFSKKDLALFIFLLLGLFSLATSENLNLSMIGFIKYLQLAVIYYLALYFLKKRKVLELTFIGVLLAGIFQGGWALLQFILGRPLGRILEESLLISPYGKRAAESVFQYRSSGTFTDPITLAIFLSLIFSFNLVEFFHKSSFLKSNFLKLTTFVFCFLGILVSFTRGVWFIVFLFSFSMIFYSFKKGFLCLPRKEIILGFLIVCLFFLPAVIPRILSVRSFFWDKYNSAASRVDLMKEAVVIIKQKPFLGVGLGNFLPAMARNRTTDVFSHFFYPVHNLYLLIASEMGILTLAAFIFFLYFSLKESLFRNTKKRKNFGGLRLGILGAVFIYLTCSLIYDSVVGLNMELFFIFLAGLSVLSKNRKSLYGKRNR